MIKSNSKKAKFKSRYSVYGKGSKNFQNFYSLIFCKRFRFSLHNTAVPTQPELSKSEPMEMLP